MIRAPVVLQDWRREEPQALPEPAGRWQGQPSTSASCAKGVILHRTLYIPACAISPFINSIQAAKSAGKCVCPGPNSALLSSPALRTACRIHTQLFIHKTNAPVDSAQEITQPNAVLKHLVLSAAALLTRLGSPAALFILHSLNLNLETKATLLPSGKGSRESPCCNKPWGGKNSI